MKVLLTGGTGFVGRNVAARLVADGHRLVCLVRDPDSPASRSLESGLDAVLVPGDVTKPESINKAAAGCDAAMHLVGIIFERGEQTFERVQAQGTRNVLTVAETAGIRRFVFMSAQGTRPGARTPYLRAKWDAEEAVRGSGLDFTIFRPSIIYGAGGEFLKMLVNQARRLLFMPVVGDGRYLVQPVSVLDVAACFSTCLSTYTTVGKTYDVGGPQAVSYNEFVDAVCAALGKRRHKLHIPVALMRAVAAVSELMPRPLVTQDQITILLSDNVCDIGPLRRDLGLEPMPLVEGLREALQ